MIQDTCTLLSFSYDQGLNEVLSYIISVCNHDHPPAASLQAARSALEKCQAKVSSASSEEEKVEAQIGVELYETLVKTLEG